MSVLRFFEWLAATPGSIALHESRYLYLIILTIHVLTLCLFVGTAVIVDLRVMGLTMPTVRVTEIITRLLPWTAAGCITMLTSGALLFYAAPLLRYQNIFFRAKMVALVLAGLNVWMFHSGVYRSVATWDLGPPPRGAKIAGGVALGFWIVLITLGRMIPYQVYWFK